MSEIRAPFLTFWLTLKRAFRFRKRPQLPYLLDYHSGDFLEEPKLRPFAPEERTRLPGFERCMACSLCTYSCRAVREGIAPPAFEPKLLLLGPGRASEEAVYTWEQWVPCATCGNCTVECPNEVPVHDVAQAIANRNAE